MMLLPRRSFLLLSTLVVSALFVLPAAAERTRLQMLAVGNSFSVDATAMLPALATAGDKDLVLARASIGGCSLERHARHLREAQAGEEGGRAYRAFVFPATGEKGEVTLIEALQAAAWDVVTLQQVSSQSFRRETFQPHLDELIAAIREHAPTAEIVLHQTWAYREDHAFFQKDDGFTPAVMYEGLTANYRALAEEKGFRLLPVGDAFQLARQTVRWTYRPDPNFDFDNPPAGELPDQRASLNVGWRWTWPKDSPPVFALDAAHANPAGRYLGACVWYATLFETDTLPDTHPPALDAESAADLRQLALTAVTAQREREAVAVSNQE